MGHDEVRQQREYYDLGGVNMHMQKGQRVMLRIPNSDSSLVPTDLMARNKERFTITGFRTLGYKTYYVLGGLESEKGVSYSIPSEWLEKIIDRKSKK